MRFNFRREEKKKLISRVVAKAEATSVPVIYESSIKMIYRTWELSALSWIRPAYLEINLNIMPPVTYVYTIQKVLSQIRLENLISANFEPLTCK